MAEVPGREKRKENPGAETETETKEGRSRAFRSAADAAIKLPGSGDTIQPVTPRVSVLSEGGGNTAQTAAAAQAGTSESGGGSGGAAETGSGGAMPRYAGGDEDLDAQIGYWSEKYRQASEAGDWWGMQEANDGANQARNKAGYAAEFAGEDIARVKAESGQKAAAGTAAGTETGVEDYSQYIRQMMAAQEELALSELRAAYEKNIGELERAQAQVAPAYEQARNAAAAQSELQKRAFHEYAAARGLNSGTGGQAQLAMGNVLQSNLKDLDRAEADALTELALQRQGLEQEYNAAIAQARLSGNYQLMQALYDEKVRQEEALRTQEQYQFQKMMQEEQLAFRKSQAAVSQDQWQQSFDRQGEQLDRERQLAAAKLMAEYGDFSGYLALGFSQELVDRMRDAYESKQGTGGKAGSGAAESAPSHTQEQTAVTAGKPAAADDLARQIEARVRAGDKAGARDLLLANAHLLTGERVKELSERYGL